MSFWPILLTITLESYQDTILQEAKTLANDTFNQIREDIVSGRLTTGSKLNESLLSKQYGVSRGPLREAIRRLEGCKLVEIKPNSGARVVSVDVNQAIEIYEIRESLEGLACKLTALRSSPEDCIKLRKLLNTHEQQIASEKGTLYHQDKGDLDFHFLIVKLSGNRHLFKLLCEELYDLLRLYRSRTNDTPSRPEQAFKEHCQIVDAIENKDGELAEILMGRHISNAKKALIGNLNTKISKLVS